MLGGDARGLWCRGKQSGPAENTPPSPSPTALAPPLPGTEALMPESDRGEWENTAQGDLGLGGTCCALSWALRPLPYGSRRWPWGPRCAWSSMGPFASLAGSRLFGATLSQSTSGLGQAPTPSCAPNSGGPHAAGTAAGGAAEARRWEEGRRGRGRWRETPGRLPPLPTACLRAAGDIAPPGQGAEKTATGGEEAAAEAGFGVSLRSGGGGPLGSRRGRRPRLRWRSVAAAVELPAARASETSRPRRAELAQEAERTGGERR